MRFRQWVRDTFVSADAVYGLILYAAIIGATSDENSTALEVLLMSALSLIIFWGAHVFAGTLANHGVRDGMEVALGSAVRKSMAHSSGMLWAAILPSLALLLGAANLLSPDDSVNLSMLLATIVLGVIGYQAFAERKVNVALRILGGLGTAAFGLLMILLNILVH